jgi:hypothetical protein
MTDGPGLRVLKAVVRALWTVEYTVRRGWARVRGRRRFRLGGACGGCARCCERPAIRGGPLTFHLPLLRRAFLWWQRRVNGFELVEADAENELWVFRCTHFDWKTRRCDSYASRPFLCRDYPRAQLDRAWPELFPECGFRPVDTRGAGLREALARTDLSEEARRELERKLYLS